MVDLVAIVESCENWVSITRKNGEEIRVRRGRGSAPQDWHALPREHFSSCMPSHQGRHSIHLPNRGRFQSADALPPTACSARAHCCCCCSCCRSARAWCGTTRGAASRSRCGAAPWTTRAALWSRWAPHRTAPCAGTGLGRGWDGGGPCLECSAYMQAPQANPHASARATQGAHLFRALAYMRHWRTGYMCNWHAGRHLHLFNNMHLCVRSCADCGQRCAARGGRQEPARGRLQRQDAVHHQLLHPDAGPS